MVDGTGWMDAGWLRVVVVVVAMGVEDCFLVASPARR